MANLETTYLGIKLKNPLIIGACNLTLDLDTAKKLEEYGASAIVFKSLFEEQIHLEEMEMEEDMNLYNDRHAEMITQHPRVQHAGPLGHLDKLSRLKQNLKIPVIGSLNCINHNTWGEYALEIEKTGVDAIELNFYATPRSYDETPDQIEAEQLKVLEEVMAKVKIPVSVKLSAFYTNVLNLVKKMDEMGVRGFVLFNHLFQPDIDVDKKAHYFPFNLSQAGDYRLPLRYAGMLYGQIKADICSNTGISNGEDALRMILAGASCVQVVSTIYRNKAEYVMQILKDMEQFMDKSRYSDIKEFQGILAKINIKDPYAYQRAQYVDLLMKPFEIINRYPQV